MTCQPFNARAARICFAQTLVVLAVGFVPLPAGWERLRSALNSARSSSLNRADLEANAGGYYEGLIGGSDGPEGSRGDLSMRLRGKPTDWMRFTAANVTRRMSGDFLQFELKPNLNRTLFGRPFTTNAHGMRDRPYSVSKPAGIFRIALLGSSIDMGWGVGSEETYVKMLEDWLNAHAARRGLARRFEVLNFAVAAHSPLQRLASFRRKAAAFDPDLVIYSATMLDTRLMEIYLCDLLRERVDLHYGFLRKVVADAGINDDDLRIDAEERFVNKDAVKRKLRPYYWSIYDDTLGTLAAECRSAGLPLACVIIPRVGPADAPEARTEAVARLRGIAAHHAIPMFDLSGTFDRIDPTKIEIAAWDDHPNARGHRRLFLALARDLVQDKTLYDKLFP